MPGPLVVALLLAAPPGVDRHGFPLPAGAIARLGSSALRGGGLGFDLTPDGQTVVTAGNPPFVERDEVKLWDAATGKPLGSLTHRWARTVLVTPDGTRAAVLGSNLSFRELATGRLLWGDGSGRAGGPDYAAVAISPDGKLVAAGGKHLQMLDAATGEVARTIERQPGNRVGAVAFSPDGDLVAAEDGGRLWLWEAITGKPVRAMDSTSNICGLAFTPDGKHLLAAVWDNRAKGVPVWEVASGKRVRTLAGHDNVMTAAVAVSPDGRWVATAGGPAPRFSDRSTGADHDIHLYEWATGERRHVLPGHFDAAAGLRFTADSKTLLSGDAVVRFWDVATGRQLRRQEGHECFIADLQFDGNKLVTAGLDNTVRTWNHRTGEQLSVNAAGPGRPTAVTLAPGGRRVAAVLADDTAVATDLTTGTELGRLPADPHRPPRFTQAGGGLLSADHTGLAVLTFGRPIRQQPVAVHGPVSVGPDGTTAAFLQSVATPAEAKAAQERFNGLGLGPPPPFALVLWDTAAGRERQRFWLTGGSVHHPLVWSPDGSRILVPGGDVLNVCDVATGAVTASENGLASGWGLAWSPDGRRYAVTANKTILVADATSHRPTAWLPLGPAQAYRLAWSADGKLLAAATGTTVLVHAAP